MELQSWTCLSTWTQIVFQIIAGKFHLYISHWPGLNHVAISINSCKGIFVVVQSVMSDSLQPHGLQHARLPCPSPSLGACSNLWPLSQWCHPAISSSVNPSPPAFNLSKHQGLFQWVGSYIRWPKCWSWSFSISPSNEYLGLISFRIDWFDLLAVQGILKSLLQHHSSKASILRHSAFFTVQLSHAYMTTGKTIALTRWTFVGKVISLLFNYTV